jgi:hypothetical protein
MTWSDTIGCLNMYIEVKGLGVKPNVKAAAIELTSRWQ